MNLINRLSTKKIEKIEKNKNNSNVFIFDYKTPQIKEGFKESIKETENKPHITIVKIKCMMYIMTIIKEELIQMGWECSFIESKDINYYVDSNTPNHYFLFLFPLQITDKVIDYKRYILYQLEQNTNNEMSLHYKKVKDLQKIYDNAALLIDYCNTNINVTKKYYSNNFKLMNVPAMNSTCVNNVNNYEYDIIFIGFMNKRRETILNKLKERYKVLVVENIYGEELKLLCNKSNICLNIHYYENAILERVRLNEMMEYGIKIISEVPCKEDIDICKYYESTNFIQIIDSSMNELFDTIEKIKNTEVNHNLDELSFIFKKDIEILKFDNLLSAEYPENNMKGTEKILILYAFHELNDRLLYFIKNGVFYDDNIDYIFICNNKSINLDHLNIPNFVKIVYRENIGYDFGAWSYGLLTNELYLNYDYFICLNSSVYGPFTKKKWTDYYINNLSQDTRLFGSTINCCGNPKKYAHIQSYIFSMSLDTLKYLIKCEIFSSINLSKSFDDCIVNKEILMSRKILENGWNISSLYPKYYKNIDFKFINKSPQEYNSVFTNDILYKNEYYKSWINESLIFVKGNRDYMVKL